MSDKKKEAEREADRLAEIADIISEIENTIDPGDDLYLITITPDPKQMPDCDFYHQHLWFSEYLLTLLQSFKTGCLCVEATQMGNPHYHGWYQTSDSCLQETARIKWMKALGKVANIKILKNPRYYKIDKWYRKSNALYYYKQDAVGAQLLTGYNPLTPKTVLPTIDYNDYNHFFTIKGRKTARDVLERSSQIQELSKFYQWSI